MGNVELELKSEKENAEVRVSNVDDYQSVVDAEWEILYEKLENCQKSGAKIILSKLPIGDVATQWFADRGIFCAGRVSAGDMNRTMKACGGSVQSTCNDLREEALGSCGTFEERQVGNERFNFFTECPQSKTYTIIIVRRALRFDSIIAGGGAVEMDVMVKLKEYARSVPGKEANLIEAFARALEIIPRQLCVNGGIDANDILSEL